MGKMNCVWSEKEDICFDYCRCRQRTSNSNKLSAIGRFRFRGKAKVKIILNYYYSLRNEKFETLNEQKGDKVRHNIRCASLLSVSDIP